MTIKKVLLPAGASMAQFRCGTPKASQELLDASREFAVEEANTLARGELLTMAGIEVNVYFHGVASTENTLVSVSVRAYNESALRSLTRCSRKPSSRSSLTYSPTTLPRKSCI